MSLKTDLIPVRDGTVAVHQTTSEGPTIVLCHGSSSSSGAFRHQLEGEIGERFRLVAIDWPGHGKSNPAARPALTYTVPGYARVLCDVADQLDVGDAVFLGWSLGGHVVLEAAGDLHDAAGFFITGAPPAASTADVGRMLSADPAIGVAFRERSSDDQIRAYLDAFFAPDLPVPRQFSDDFTSTDGAARAAVGASVALGEFRDEVRVVAEMRRPLAIVQGELDRIVNRAYLDDLRLPNLWRGKIQYLSGVGHTPQWEAPAVFDALLDAFATDCNR